MFNTLTGTEILFFLVSLIIGIIVHELMHGVVAYWLGDRTAADAGRLTLNPLASIDPVMTIILPAILFIWQGFLFLAAKPVPFNPSQVKWAEYGAALVALAGPVTNFVLALLGALLFYVSGGVGMIGLFAQYFTVINVGIMVFNLIPIPPLDGSRVLYAVAPEPVQRVMDQIESLGFIFLLVVLFVAYRFISPVISGVQQAILQVLLVR